MNPWIGETAFLLGLVVFVAIRVPHDKRSKETKIAESHKGAVEVTLLALMGWAVSFFRWYLSYPRFFPSPTMLFDYCRFWAASCASVFHFGSFTGLTPIWAQTGPTVWNFVKTINS